MDRTDLSHDAFTINGVYLEDVISGYTTTKAAGRESLEKKLETYDNGTDGEILNRTKYPTRIIAVSYLLQGSSLADMREKMHSLQTYLNVEGAQIIFNDDPTCYYIGTPVMTGQIKDVWNGSIGTINIVCHDPFKYALNATTVQTTSYTEQVEDEDGNTSSVTSTVITTNNSGGYKTFPTFTVQFASDESAGGDVGSDADCGYVLFAKGGTNYSVQIGNDQEKDTGTVTEVSHSFTAASKGSFVDTNSITPFRSALVFNGSSKATSKGLMINATTTVAKKFHGPMVVYSLAAGHEASGEFTLSWKNIFACAKDTATGKKQSGAMWVMLLDSSNNVKFAYGIEKSSKTKLTAKEYVYSYYDGLWSMDDAYPVKYTGPSGYKSSSDTSGRLSTCVIKRVIEYDDDNNPIGASVILQTAESAEADICVEDTLCTISKVAVFFGNYGSNAALHSNRMTWIKFVNGSVDLVNTFGSDDVAVVDCGKAEILLNNKTAPNLGDVGNNWEDMHLDVGTNTIYVQYSDWVVAGYEPTITMSYKKRWL